MFYLNLDTWTLISISAAVSALIIFVLAFTVLLRKARAYSLVMSEDGLPPPPSANGTRWLRCLARFLVFIQVGKIKIIGAENLDRAGENYLVTPNHPHWADTCVMPIVMNRPARYMAAKAVFDFAGGIGGLLVGPMGAFPANLNPGQGSQARENAVKLVSSGEPLVMFPEGWAYLDGKIGPFKKGAVRIAREAAAISGKTTKLVPVHIRYGRYPGSWIRKLHPTWEYLLVFMLFPLYRRGCTVVIGEPLSSEDLPTGDEAATEFLKKQILSLDLQNSRKAI